jgi:hypothetical protein
MPGIGSGPATACCFRPIGGTGRRRDRFISYLTGWPSPHGRDGDQEKCLTAFFEKNEKSGFRPFSLFFFK